MGNLNNANREPNLTSKWLPPLAVFVFMLCLSSFFTLYQLQYNQSFQLQTYNNQGQAVARRLGELLSQEKLSDVVSLTNHLANDKRIVKMVIFDHQLNQIHSWPFSQRTTPPSLADKLTPWTSDYWIKQEIRLEDTVKGYIYTQISFNTLLLHAQKSIYVGVALSVLFSLICLWIIRRPYKHFRQFILGLASLMRDFNPKSTPHTKAQKHYTLALFKADFDALLQSIKAKEKYQDETMAQLEKRKVFAETIIETVQHSLVVLDKTYCIKRANQAFYNLMEDNEDDFIDLFLPDFMPQISEHKAELDLIFIGDRWQYRNQLTLTSNNKTKYLRFTATRLSQIGHASQLLLALEDITSEITSARQTQLAAKMFQANRNGVVILDRRHYIQMINPAMQSLLTEQLDGIELRGDFKQLIANAKQRQLIDNILAQTKSWHGKEELTFGEESIPFEINYTAIFDKQGNKEYSILQFADLRESYQIEKLEKMALHDELTGLPNRANLMQSLEKTQTYHQHRKLNYAIAFLDLDGFKQVNDNYGHDAGDYLLQQTAQRLRQHIRQTDLAARLAGDEFVLVLENYQNINALHKLAQKLLEALTQPCQLGAESFAVSASIGIIYVNQASIHMAISEQLKLADEAMYQAKQQGKNQVVIRET
ncbi:diguanylate cyclase domain-containing protein [Motilimonas sp. KMU-193]|uniref:diguanylate cyclase domain-containing protein n=1 Tax=Motilimonas sp. KMU-193 TaxID=3388668 RepID=UPI00396B30FC